MKTQKGLTLIELLITIAVVAIVAAISVPVINNVILSAKANADRNQAVIVMDFIAEWESGILLQTGNLIEGYLETELIKKISVPDGYLLAGSGTESDPYLLLVNPPAVETQATTEQSGTLPDGEGTTYAIDATGITITTTSANWETMAIQYNNGATNDAISKKFTNGTTVGALTKVSNTEVRINTVSLGDFTFGIVYNGGSTGSFTFN